MQARWNSSPTWKGTRQSLAATVQQKRNPRQALLIYADRYSEEMRKIGRGAEELGKDAKFPGVGWQARAAIHTATGVWAD
jgi:hypothetical protein